MLLQFLSVAIGGAAGACVRYGLALLFPFVPGYWPVASFVANVVGCFIMGGLYYLIQHAHLPITVKPLLIAGFLGAMTTFSSFALEAWLLLQHNAHLLAIAYLIVSVVACVGAVAFGYALTTSAVRLMP
ncbi:MAG TPA: CrcB family protein [Marinagarivorans sp.]